MNSDSGFRTFFAHKSVSGQFQFTARIASVTTASGEFTARGNTFGYGIMVMQDVPEQPVTAYTDVPRFATVNLYTNTITPTFNGSRAVKVDSASGNRSRSNIDGLSVGHYVRLQVFVDTQNPSIKRVRRYTSIDGVDFTQANSTPWTGTVGDDWYVGFYGAPGDEDLFIRFDNVVLEPYDPSATSSSAASSSAPANSSSSSNSEIASSSSTAPASSSVASSSEVANSSSEAASSTAPASSSVASSSEIASSSSEAVSSVASSESSSSVSSVGGGGTSSDASSSSSPAWTGAALELVGPSDSVASGNVDVNEDTAVTLTAAGGNLSSTSHNLFFAYQQIAKSDFVFTARIASVSGANTASSNSYRFGLMVMSDINVVTNYADLAAWADIGFYVNGTPSLVGSRANMKTDNTRSRSDIAALAVGDYIRIEVFDDGALKRVRRLTSTDGINFTQANSTTDFKATSSTDSWFVGLYAAPGVNTLAVEFDNITIEDYVAP